MISNHLISNLTQHWLWVFSRAARLSNVTKLRCVALYCIIASSHCALASGALYCNRSCLCVCLWRAGGRAGGVCYHDNSKLCASIFTKLGL